ncbi:hypothetical protein [Humibacter sp.]|uniref:hypothetical protein n=1 Tax=Humibacter sp. TaxID=1940291 RepID=UPI002C53AC24|nr:hypothetical protein [Humibacter sp.]HVX07613.1 hypothetical protein [Humibacter sp.]
MKQVRAERRTDDEAREALIGVLVRVLDEFRFGVRALSPEELVDLARAWAIINAGETPAEAALRLATATKDVR